MAYTSHGHLIPNSIFSEDDRPDEVARCGGPKVCSKCALEVVAHASRKGSPVVETEDSLNKSTEELAAELASVVHISNTKNNKEKNTMKAEKYKRIPFEVEAVQVTDENFEEVAAWCGGDIITVQSAADSLDFPDADTKRYIQVDVARPLNQRQTQAYVGDWVLYALKGFKVYMNRPFAKNFIKVDDKDAPQELMVTDEAVK